MEAWLISATEATVLAINALALLFVACATLGMLLGVCILLLRMAQRGARAHRAEVGAIWLDYARWLVAALTLQLGADIVESAIAPSWESIGQLAAVAVIRTFLNYFLERDMMEQRTPRQEAVPEERAI